MAERPRFIRLHYRDGTFKDVAVASISSVIVYQGREGEKSTVRFDGKEEVVMESVEAILSAIGADLVQVPKR